MVDLVAGVVVAATPPWPGAVVVVDFDVDLVVVDEPVSVDVVDEPPAALDVVLTPSSCSKVDVDDLAVFVSPVELDAPSLPLLQAVSARPRAMASEIERRITPAI